MLMSYNLGRQRKPYYPDIELAEFIARVNQMFAVNQTGAVLSDLFFFFFFFFFL